MKNIVNTKDCQACKWCCIFFNKKEESLSPFFSDVEYEKISDKTNIKKNKNGFFQAKVIESKQNEKNYVCSFLDEGKYSCSIYKKRPIDCIIWPFVVGWDKDEKNIYLWVVNKSSCPVVDIDKINKSTVVDEIIGYLVKKKYFEEIRDKKRPIWPYEKYQIKLRNLTKFINL